MKVEIVKVFKYRQKLYRTPRTASEAIAWDMTHNVFWKKFQLFLELGMKQDELIERRKKGYIKAKRRILPILEKAFK